MSRTEFMFTYDLDQPTNLSEHLFSLGTMNSHKHLSLYTDEFMGTFNSYVLMNSWEYLFSLCTDKFIGTSVVIMYWWIHEHICYYVLINSYAHWLCTDEFNGTFVMYWRIHGHILSFVPMNSRAHLSLCTDEFMYTFVGIVYRCIYVHVCWYCVPVYSLGSFVGTVLWTNSFMGIFVGIVYWSICCHCIPINSWTHLLVIGSNTELFC